MFTNAYYQYVFLRRCPFWIRNLSEWSWSICHYCYYKRRALKKWQHPSSIYRTKYTYMMSHLVAKNARATRTVIQGCDVSAANCFVPCICKWIVLMILYNKITVWWWLDGSCFPDCWVDSIILRCWRIYD